MTPTIDESLPAVSDAMLMAALNGSAPFTVAILKAGPRFVMPGSDRPDEIAGIIWAHGKRNYALHLAGLLPVVCPIGDGSGVTGVGVFRADEDAVRAILDNDPAMVAGVLTYELHPTRTFTIPAAAPTRSCVSG
jgi:hypothetical protein